MHVDDNYGFDKSLRRKIARLFEVPLDSVSTMEAIRIALRKPKSVPSG